MFEFKKFNKNGLILKDTDNKELITLSTHEEICAFLTENIDDLDSPFLNQVLGKVKNPKLDSFFAEKIWPMLGDSLYYNNKHMFNALKNNLHLLNEQSFNQFMDDVSDNNDWIISLFNQYKNSPDINMSWKINILEFLQNDKIKLDFLNSNKDLLDINSKQKIASTYSSDKLKLDFLNQEKELNENLQIEILGSLKRETFTKLYNSNTYDVQRLIPIEDVFAMNLLETKDLLKLIDKHITEFHITSLQYFEENFSNSFPMDSFLSILEKNIKVLNSDQIFFLMSKSEPQKQQKYFDTYKRKLNDTQKFLILSTLQESSKGSNYEEDLKEINLSDVSKNTAKKIYQNFGPILFCSEDVNQLFAKNNLSYFNEDNLYLFIKYFIYTGKAADISKAVENPELFEKFQAFRAQHLPQSNLEVKNVQNSFLEFNKYYSLIEECFNSDMTEQEQALLISALTDKNIDLSNKEDLHNYESKRSAYIDQLAVDNIEYALIYILTGLSQEDYFEKEALFFSEDQLAISSSEFSEELQDRILLMQSAKDLIDIIKNEPAENQHAILESLKMMLEMEFSHEGSPVADLRNSFPEFESELRVLYGKELKESLTLSPLPPAKKKGKAEIIKLNGEDFKLLVHGLNAYGSGSSSYESREIGRSYICTSLISDKHLKRAEAKIYYGFKNISGNSLGLEGPSDIYSFGEKNSLDLTSNHSNTKFLKTDRLLDESRDYNEIVLYRDQTDKLGHVKPLMPDYIVAFNRIRKQDLKEAERLNIPIVLINESIYQNNLSNEDESTFIEDIKEEPEIEIEKQKQENAIESTETRNIMLQIIQMAASKCTARQQEAIMAEIQKEYKLSITKGDAVNV